MLVTYKEVLSAASAGGYAVGAFNINNMEILQVIIKSAVEEKSPIIVSSNPSAIKYAGSEYLSSLAIENMKKVVKEKIRLFGSSQKAV